MRKIFSDAVKFCVIVAIAAAVCMFAGLCVTLLWNAQAGISVFLFGTLLGCLAMGTFD